MQKMEVKTESVVAIQCLKTVSREIKINAADAVKYFCMECLWPLSIC